MKKITIVDYGLGNLDSIQRAFRHLGSEAVISSDPGEIANSDRLVLPGVGAFGAAMANLRERRLIEPLGEYFHSDRPVLGICLGMQLFMERSEEQGEHEGLGWIAGEVKCLSTLTQGDRNGVKVPHIGWSELDSNGLDWTGTILSGIKNCEYVYFAHSYVVIPQAMSQALAHAKYGGAVFCAVIASENIIGCQFHPEKSGNAGLGILRNFVKVQ